MPFLNEQQFVDNAEISYNQGFGFYISDKEQKVFYLLKNGEINHGCISKDNTCNGYWKKEEQAEYFLKGWKAGLKQPSFMSI